MITYMIMVGHLMDCAFVTSVHGLFSASSGVRINCQALSKHLVSAVNSTYGSAVCLFHCERHANEETTIAFKCGDYRLNLDFGEQIGDVVLGPLEINR